MTSDNKRGVTVSKDTVRLRNDNREVLANLCIDNEVGAIVNAMGPTGELFDPKDVYSDEDNLLVASLIFVSQETGEFFEVVD